MIFAGQLVYLISIMPFYSTYFAHGDSMGLISRYPFGWKPNKLKIKFFYILWISSLIYILILPSTWATMAFATYVVCASRIFFVATRYESLGRGNGAPGFMSYWSTFYGLGFVISQHIESLLPYVIVTLAVDLFLIFLSAGIFKYFNGYASGQGIEFGLVNPVWSIWYKRWIKIPPNSLIFSFLNVFSIISELGISLFLLHPKTWWLSSCLLILMFIFLMSCIRLGTLPITMIIIGGTLFLGQKILLEGHHQKNDAALSMSLLYILLLIMSYIWTWSFNKKVQLPFFLSKLTRWSYGLTGAIIWSVFTVKITSNYFECNQEIKRKSSLRTFDFAKLTSPDLGVHSGITLATLRTFLDYFPNDNEAWEHRCLLYFMAHPELNSLVYYKINKLKEDWTIQPELQIQRMNGNIHTYRHFEE